MLKETHLCNWLWLLHATTGLLRFVTTADHIDWQLCAHITRAERTAGNVDDSEQRRV